MEYRKLGESELYVSSIALGCWPLVGGFNWGNQDEKDSLETLHAAYDLGINFYDTAEGYGSGYSEQLVGKALASKRHHVVIATKVSKNNLHAIDLRASCEASLKNLNTDYIDLYQIHWPNPEIPLEETIGCMRELKEEGKIREIGVSNFGARSLKECRRLGVNVVSNQVAYNLLFRAIEYEILPLCEQRQISILPYCPIMQGLLTGKFKNPDEVPEDRARSRHFSPDRPHSRHDDDGAEALTFKTIDRLREVAEKSGLSMANLAQAWLLAQPSVPTVLTGARKPEQVQRNAEAAKVLLASALIEELNSVTKPLKERLGDNPDLWQSSSRVI